MELINNQTNEIEDIPAEQVGSSYLSGKYSFRKGTPVPLLDRDGKLDHYNPEDVYEAINRGGYKFPDSSQIEEKRVQDTYGHRKLEAAALGAADMLTFGMATRGAKALGVPEEYLKQVPEQNPVSHTVGGIGTAIATLGIGPEAFFVKKAADALKAAQLTGDAAAIAKAESTYRQIKNAVTAFDQVNPISKVTKGANAAADAIIGSAQPVGALGKIGQAAAKGFVREGLEGAAYTAGELNREAALGDPDLSVGKIASTLGFGALTGGALGAIAGGGFAAGKLAKQKVFPSTFADAVRDSARATVESSPVLAESVSKTVSDLEAPLSTEDLMRRMEGVDIPSGLSELPSKKVIVDAQDRLKANGVNLKFPAHNAQLSSLDSKLDRDQYSFWLDKGSDQAKKHLDYQAAQKVDAMQKLEESVKKINGGVQVIEDNVEAGNKLAKSAYDNIQRINKELEEPFKRFDKAGANIVGNPEKIILKMEEAIPEVSKYLKVDPDLNKISLSKYSDGMPFDRTTYRMIKNTIESVNNESLTLGEIRNLKNKIGNSLNKMSGGYTQNRHYAERLKSALMDFVAEEVDKIDPSVGAKEISKRYAINKNNREILESIFGGSLYEKSSYRNKLVPEDVIKRIFSDSVSVKAAQDILGPKEFNQALATYLKQNINKVSDPSSKAFSSSRFSNFLKSKASALDQAFSLDPKNGQIVRDLTDFMRFLPDAAPTNTSRTAPAVFNMFKAVLEPVQTMKELGAKVKGGLDEAKQAEIVNQMMKGQSAEKAKEEVAKKVTAYNAIDKMQEMVEKANKKIFNLSKKAVEPAEKVIKRSIGPAAGKIVTPERKKEIEEEKHLENVKRYKKVTKQIGTMVNNADYMMKVLEASSKGVDTVAPNIGTAVQQSVLTGLTFLSSKMPKPKMESLFPEEYIPSKQELSKFMRYMDTLEDPLSVLTSLANNSVSIEQIETLSAVQPALLQDMRLKVFENLYELKEKPSYQKKLALSMFLGQDVDSSLSGPMIAANQASFIAMNNGGSQQKDGNIKATQKGLGKIAMASRATTPLEKSAQRSESRET